MSTQLNTNVYQMPTDPTSINQIWGNNAQACDAVPAPTIGDLFETAGSLAEAQGTSDQCKKYTDTGLYSQSVSGSASAGLFGGSLLGGSAAFKEQATAVMNHAAQEGCGTILTTANNVLQSTQKLQCIINNSMSSTTSVANMSNNVTIVGQPLTPQQDAALASLLAQQNSLISTMTSDGSKQISNLILSNATDAQISKYTDYINNLITLTKANYANQIAAYTRNVSLNTVKILQTISGTIKTQCQLNTVDQTQASALAQNIAQNVAGQSLAVALGTSAQDPAIKSAVANNSQISDNLSTSKINNMIAEAESHLSTSNNIVITTAGNINLNNVTFDQNIVVDMITSAIQNNAIAVGLQAATDMSTNNSLMASITANAKGLDDLTKAIAGLSDVPTAAPVPEGSTASTIGLYIFLIVLCIVAAGGAYWYYTMGPGLGKGKSSGSESGNGSGSIA